MTTVETTVEILRGAKVELAKRGHIKGRFFNAKGGVCLMGACAAVARELRDVNFLVYPSANSALRLAIMGFHPERCRAGGAAFCISIADWNDHPSTTIDDVQALLDRAIALTEGK